jgi:outer membrane protein assembly factor BamB
VKGGLIVHLGCADGELTAALGADQGCLVHGLDIDRGTIRQARQYLRSRGLYGRVSADVFDGKRLPYADNLVNLLVVGRPFSVDRQELLRVLRPGGVALLMTSDEEETTDRIVKPHPAEIDDWTHYLYDATNNAVSKDRVIDFPGRLQWLGSPRWSRHHDHMASTSAMVSADGRLFYIFDEGSTASILLPSKWSLLARDAFNGVILWKRPIREWHTQMFRLKSGPSQLPRRLVAEGSRVYVTLGLDAPLSALDAATGKTVHTYEGTRATEEVILSQDVLFLVTADKPFKQPTDPKKLIYEWPESERCVMAVRAETGETLWKKPFSWVVPLTLAADARRVYFHDGEKIVCLDRASGGPLWTSEPVARKKPLPSYYAPTLVVYHDVVLFTGGANLVPHKGADDTMTAFSAETGETLWTAPHPPSGYQSPEDILVADGLVWTGAVAAREDTGNFTGRNLLTGDVERDFPPDVPQRYGHHRCYRAKATERYLLTSRNGIEFLDVRTLHWTTTRWVRGGCLYGIMPANGLIYTPAHDCACNIERKLYGFCALAPGESTQPELRRTKEGDRLEKGRAYADVRDPASIIQHADDWPTYRRDGQRNGFTPRPVPIELKQAWRAELGGALTSPVLAGGRAFVASKDAHTVHALDAQTGQVLWEFTAGGRVDSPPTVDRGRVLFGSADGSVYSLRAADGELAWRYRAAPEDRRLVAWEQLESVWPLHGSVLVQDGVVWCVCGRSIYLGGGLRLLRLDAATGKRLSETLLDPESAKVGLPDILSCDGRYVYMRSQTFDLDGNLVRVPGAGDVQQQAGETAHLFCPTGFLDDSWWHRSYWVFGRRFAPGATGYFMAGRFAPSGKLLVFDETTVYGFGRKPQYFRWTTPLERQLFASSKEPEVLRKPKEARRKPPGPGLPKAVLLARETQDAKIAHQWSRDVPLQVRAMVLADKTLFLAGPPDVLEEGSSLATFASPDTQQDLVRQAAALEGRCGGLLVAVSAADGQRLAGYRLDSMPVFDGMAAANGKLYLSTVDGKILCLGAGQGEPLQSAPEAAGTARRSDPILQ